jgi:hypothetical protein
MKMGLTFIADMSDAGSWAIRSAIGGPFSHCLVRFYSDAGTLGEETVYFESIWKTDKETGKNGLRGPIPIERLTEWQDEDTANHVVYHQPWLPVTDLEAMRAYQYLEAYVPKIKYAKLQLAKNGIYAATGLWLIRRTGTQKHWQCAETCGRALPARLWPALGIGDVVFDMLVPSGRRGIGLFELTEAILRGHTE